MKYGFSYLYHVVNAGTYKLLHTGLLLIFSAGIWAQQTSVTVIDDQSSEPCMLSLIHI